MPYDVLRPCLTCNKPSKRDYCPEHQPQRNTKPRTQTTTQRGYGSAHQRKARECITAQPWCSWCGATEDLTANHLIHGDPSSEYITLCRSCNSSEAAERRRAR